MCFAPAGAQLRKIAPFSPLRQHGCGTGARGYSIHAATGAPWPSNGCPPSPLFTRECQGIEVWVALHLFNWHARPEPCAGARSTTPSCCINFLIPFPATPSLDPPPGWLPEPEVCLNKLFRTTLFQARPELGGGQMHHCPGTASLGWHTHKPRSCVLIFASCSKDCMRVQSRPGSMVGFANGDASEAHSCVR